jgi:hypothetical protein
MLVTNLSGGNPHIRCRPSLSRPSSTVNRSPPSCQRAMRINSRSLWASTVDTTAISGMNSWVSEAPKATTRSVATTKCRRCRFSDRGRPLDAAEPGRRRRERLAFESVRNRRSILRPVRCCRLQGLSEIATVKVSDALNGGASARAAPVETRPAETKSTAEDC